MFPSSHTVNNDHKGATNSAINKLLIRPTSTLIYTQITSSEISNDYDPRQNHFKHTSDLCM